jgi:Lipocalin-like domain
VIYDADGNMAGQIMRRDRPAFASGSSHHGTPDEIKAAFEGYSAYFGTYAIDLSEGVVRYQLEGSLFPNWVDSDQIREFEITGNLMYLRIPVISVGEEKLSGLFVWERLES